MKGPKVERGRQGPEPIFFLKIRRARCQDSSGPVLLLFVPPTIYIEGCIQIGDDSLLVLLDSSPAVKKLSSIVNKVSEIMRLQGSGRRKLEVSKSKLTRQWFRCNHRWARW